MRFLISIVILFYTTAALGSVGMEICHDHETSRHSIHNFYEGHEDSDHTSIDGKEEHDFHTKLHSEHFASTRQNDEIAPKLFIFSWFDLHLGSKPENKLQVAIFKLFESFYSHQLRIEQNIRSTVILC